MLAKESAPAATFDLPEEVLAVLPSDPYEQLDVARKITSMALSTRVSSLESESSDLRAKLAEKDHSIADLQSQVESLDASLADALDKLSRSELEKEKLVKENEWLTTTVEKLSRDASKWEIFKKTLMQSLQEDEDSSGPARAGASHIIANPTPSGNKDQMNAEDSMAEDTVVTTTPSVPVFGQQPISPQPSTGFMFNPPASTVSNPFQFGSQQNLATPPNPSPFQASGSLDLGGGSFLLGTGGDKSGRKIIIVKHKQRRK
ncbi:uncharacterized protein At4g15545-like [Syzygium oleosum]|uniref:uncharacterized protein At4g15545-like n=1 Tax=Syzygium oleosum TaxID=219896 RepID=UPI0024BAEF98|nr:uncharacterized protein At4g15545-like [Syzygium oleosum]